MTMSRYKVDFNSMNWETLMPGLNQKSFNTQNKQIRLVEYAKQMQPHVCEKMHCGYVIDGILETSFENETVVYRPGDFIFIPGGAEHRHVGKTLTEKVRVIFVEDI